MSQDNSPPILTDEMVRSITGTGPWIRLMSILGFVSVGFLLLGGILMAATSVMGSAIDRQLGIMFLMPMSILYMLLAIVFFFPSLYLWQTAGAIIRVRKGELSAGTATALDRQRKFWKFIGIVTICLLALYPVLIVVIIFGG